MSYSPSDRCPECGRFQDCICEPERLCDWCGHEELAHTVLGCLVGGLHDACECVGFNPTFDQ
jgi:hypothetical protein